MALTAKEADPSVAKSPMERRRFRRVRLDLAGRLFVPGEGKEAHCTVLDLSAGGAAVACETIPEASTQVVLYVQGFGRFEGVVIRHGAKDFGMSFASTPAKRERTAKKITMFLNKNLADDIELSLHARSGGQRGFACFTRADGEVVHCTVKDISLCGVSLTSEVRPAVGEFVLIAGVAGRIARHHEHGIDIEFVGRDKRL